MQTNPAAFFSLFPSLVAPFTTSMTSLTSPPGRLARWLGVEAEVEGGKSSPLRFLFPPRGRRKPSDVFFFLDSGAGSPLSSRFSRFSLPVSAPPRHVTARTAPTSLRESRQAREKEGEAKAKRSASFFFLHFDALASLAAIDWRGAPFFFPHRSIPSLSHAVFLLLLFLLNHHHPLTLTKQEKALGRRRRRGSPQEGLHDGHPGAQKVVQQADRRRRDQRRQQVREEIDL